MYTIVVPKVSCLGRHRNEIHNRRAAHLLSRFFSFWIPGLMDRNVTLAASSDLQ